MTTKQITKTITQQLEEKQDIKDKVFPLPVGKYFDDACRARLRCNNLDLYVLDRRVGLPVIKKAIEDLDDDNKCVEAHILLVRNNK